jgi:hypothetical protein
MTAQTFVEKDGVFTMGMTNTGVPVMSISDTDTSSLVIDTRTENAAIVSDVIFTNEVNDSVGTVVSSNNITYIPSFNPDIRVNKQAAVFNGVDSEVILGPVLYSINKKLTMSAWLNVANLQDDQSYPIISTTKGLSWNINKVGGVLSTELTLPTFPTINDIYNVPGTYTWVSPGNGKITIELQGGDGGDYQTTRYGGNGGYLCVDVDVVSGVEYTIIIGGQGEKNTNTTYSTVARHGAGGGGGTGFKVSTEETWMVIAGGGGGAADTGNGGAGGIPGVFDGTNGNGTGQGKKGTTTQGGAGGTGRKNGVDGKQYVGGRAATEKTSDILGGEGIGNGGKGGIGGNDYCGGGGGGGWYGGGGGAINSNGHGGGGGGGSSYYDTTNPNISLTFSQPSYFDNLGNGYVKIVNYVEPPLFAHTWTTGLTAKSYVSDAVAYNVGDVIDIDIITEGPTQYSWEVEFIVGLTSSPNGSDTSEYPQGSYNYLWYAMQRANGWQVYRGDPLSANRYYNSAIGPGYPGELYTQFINQYLRMTIISDSEVEYKFYTDSSRTTLHAEDPGRIITQQYSLPAYVFFGPHAAGKSYNINGVGNSIFVIQQ